MSRTASRGSEAPGTRALFPSEPWSILYRITAAPLTSLDDERQNACAPDGRILPSAPRRPGDSFERVSVPLATHRQLAIAGAEAALPVDVAATLVAEAALLLERLDQHRLRGARQLLDRAASSSRVTRALSSSSADYLRALSCRSWRRHVPELDLPVRIASRLGERAEERLAHCELLDAAVKWEIAAVLCERTMENWGSDVALGGFR